MQMSAGAVSVDAPDGHSSRRTRVAVSRRRNEPVLGPYGPLLPFLDPPVPMRPSLLAAHALLWATAILASALLDAPTALTLLVLPSLAVVAFLMGVRRTPAKASV